MIKTKLMLTRENAANGIPYVDSDNNIQGTIDPLKLFICQYGVDGNNGITDAVNKHYAAQAAATISVAANGLVSSDVENWTLQNSSGDAAVDQVAVSLDAAAEDDVLIVGVGTNNTSIVAFPDDMFFTLKNLTGGVSVISARSRDSGVVTTGYFTDSDPTIVSVADALPYMVTGTPYMYAGAFDRSGDMTIIRDTRNADAGVDVSTSLAAATAGLDYSIDPILQLRCKFHGFAVFRFKAGTLPPDWRTEAKKMAWNWAAGNYVFPVDWGNL